MSKTKKQISAYKTLLKTNMMVINLMYRKQNIRAAQRYFAREIKSLDYAR